MIAALFATLVAVVPTASPSPVTAAPAGLPAVAVSGDLVRSGASIDAAARMRLPRSTVGASDPDKTVAAYGGVLLADVLRDAGALAPAGVRGPAARAYVVVHAADHYSAIYSLAKLQTAEGRCAPLVADTRDGAPIAAESGPLRIVAPCDLTHARWVRNVTSLGVVVAPGEPGAPAEMMHH